MELHDAGRPVEFIIDDPADITPVSPAEFTRAPMCRCSLVPLAGELPAEEG